MPAAFKKMLIVFKPRRGGAELPTVIMVNPVADTAKVHEERLR